MAVLTCNSSNGTSETRVVGLRPLATQLFRTIATLALLVGAARVAPAQLAKEADRAVPKHPEILEFQIKDTKALGKGDLETALATHATSCKFWLIKPLCLISKWSPLYDHRFLDEDEFKRDMLRVKVYYFRRGYRDTRVDTTLVRGHSNDVRITLKVIEGPPTVVEDVRVRGIGRAIARDDTSRVIRPRVGDPLNLLELDSSVTRIRARLQDKGYADADIKSKAEANDTTRVAKTEITVDRKKPVTIGDIEITGNDHISEETIRNSLGLNKGDLYRSTQITNSQRLLYESALFRRASIDTAPRATASGKSSAVDSTSRPDTVKGLIVQVVEGPQREASTSFGFTTADFVQAQGTFTHHYLFNRPLTLNATATVGNLLAPQLSHNSFFANISDITLDSDLGRYYAPTYQVNLDLTQRYVGSPRNTVGAGVFVRRTSSPGVLVDKGYGGNVTFTRELATRVPLSLHYQFEETSVDAGDVYFCVNYGVCDNATIRALRGEQRLSPVTLTISVDRTDIPFSPTRGILAHAELEHASTYTGSSFHYNRASADFAAYRKIGRGNTLVGNTVVAARVRAGWVDPLASTASAVGDGGLINQNLQILHPRKRFYAGGAGSVRGFGENQLGPRVLTISADTLAKGARVGKDTTTIVCAPTAPSAACLAALKDNAFQTRPLGGTTLLEGGVELRIPVRRAIVAALFVDAAVLGNGSVSAITSGTSAITPGFGVRYQSPVGPIRVDLGIRPTLKTALPVITEMRDSTGHYRLVDLTGGLGCPTKTSVGCRVYPGAPGQQSFLNRLTNRLTLHLSIGEAY